MPASLRTLHVMYDQLISRLASLLAAPRALKPQTERQLAGHLAERSSSLASFLLCAADSLEDHELEILFGPIFTPSLDERAVVADLLFHWRPSREQLHQLVSDLGARVSEATILLPDGTQAPLTLHEVMIDRFVRLLRLDAAPDPATSATLRESLRSDLWPISVALMCEHGMTPAHQRLLALFVHHVSTHRPITREMLETMTAFIAQQKKLDRVAILAAAEALMRATQGTAAYAAGGHAYWSPDVAQHHQYRGEGKVDQQRLEERQAEVERVTTMTEDWRTFEFESPM